MYGLSLRLNIQKDSISSLALNSPQPMASPLLTPRTAKHTYNTFSPRHTPALQANPTTKKFHERYHPSAYHISRLADYDDIDFVKPWHRKLLLVQPLILVFALISYISYFSYRVLCNYRYQLLHGGVHFSSWVFTVVEAVVQRRFSPPPFSSPLPCSFPVLPFFSLFFFRLLKWEQQQKENS